MEVLGSEHVQETLMTVALDNARGPCTFRLFVQVCPNQECRSLSASVSLYRLSPDGRGSMRIEGGPERTWKLIPASNARLLPDYVPERIAREYTDACAVMDLSPAASATLGRRCLQAIIRDFFAVKKNTLADELDAIREKLDPEVWEAIDAARKNGNIGKNMEKGVNLIVDTDPGEPAVLIGLIEYFIQECYIARHERKMRLEAMRGRSLKPPH
jgi:hypothetical protein